MTSPKPKPTPSFVPVVEPDSTPANQTAVTAQSDVRTQPLTNAPRPTTPPQSVPNAEPSLTILKNDMQQGTVQSGANDAPPNDATGNGNRKSSNDSVVPLNSRGFVVPPVIGECEQCGGKVVRKSRNGRLPKFCSSNCRVKQWRINKTEPMVSNQVG